MSYKDTKLYQFIEDRLDSNRDVKVLITARNGQTGVGKTTLGLLLCMVHDRNEFDSSKAFHDGMKYMRYYLDATPGDSLLLDDFGFDADSRRGTSHSNVRISQIWQILRHKNVLSIATLPTPAVLDKRFIRLADLRLNVLERGKFKPYMIVTHDFEGYIRQYGFPDKKTYEFEKMDHNEIYREIAQDKHRYVADKLEEWTEDD